LHGNLWNLRGLTVRSAANGDSDANSRYGAVVALLGTEQTVTSDMVRGLQEAVQTFRRAFPRAKEIRGHVDVRPEPTACPGPALLRLIRSGALEPDNPAEEEDMNEAQFSEWLGNSLHRQKIGDSGLSFAAALDAARKDAAGAEAAVGPSRRSRPGARRHRGRVGHSSGRPGEAHRAARAAADVTHRPMRRSTMDIVIGSTGNSAGPHLHPEGVQAGTWAGPHLHLDFVDWTAHIIKADRSTPPKDTA
jgi:hypothetical protein